MKGWGDGQSDQGQLEEGCEHPAKNVDCSPGGGESGPAEDKSSPGLTVISGECVGC